MNDIVTQPDLQDKVQAAIRYLRGKNIYKLDQGHKHKYVPAVKTDVAKLFRRIRGEAGGS